MRCQCVALRAVKRTRKLRGPHRTGQGEAGAHGHSFVRWVTTTSASHAEGATNSLAAASVSSYDHCTQRRSDREAAAILELWARAVGSTRWSAS